MARHPDPEHALDVVDSGLWFLHYTLGTLFAIRTPKASHVHPRPKFGREAHGYLARKCRPLGMIHTAILHVDQPELRLVPDQRRIHAHHRSLDRRPLTQSRKRSAKDAPVFSGNDSCIMRTSATILLLLPITALHSQWEWTQAVQSNALEPEWGHVVRYCADSGFVVTGQWRTEARFGDITFTGTVEDQMNAFVVRYAADGTPEWAHTFRSSAPDRSTFIYGLANQADGSVIVGGHAPDSLLMDNTLLTYDEGGAGNISAWFIAKFNADGSLAWAVDREASINGAELWDLSVDQAGNIWVGGSIDGTNSNRLIKFSGADGTVLFTSDPIPGRLARVRITPNGDILLHGISANTFAFAGMTCPYNTALGGSSTSWTLRLQADGTPIWYYAPDQGNSGYPYWGTLCMSASEDGSTYVASLGKTRINGDTISFASGSRGIYKLDAQGEPLWWHAINTTGALNVHDMAVAHDGSCWVVGDMAGNYDLGDTVVTHQGLFAFQYSSDGDVLHRLFGPNVVDCWSVDTRTNNEILLAGTQTGTMSFGEHSISDNWFGMFAARYGVPNDVGIAENPGPMQVVAYPNPAHGPLRLSGDVRTPVRVTVLNAVGQYIRRVDQFNLNTDVIDLSDLPAGILVIDVTSSSQRAILRVIHQP